MAADVTHIHGGVADRAVSPIQMNSETGLPHAYMRVTGIEGFSFNKKWIAEGLIESGRVYQWFGQWKSGKTLAVMDVCCHISLGRLWADRRTVQSLVIWVASESCEDVLRRMAAWRLSHGISGDMPFIIRTKPIHLDEEQFAKLLSMEIDAVRRVTFPDLEVVVVIDTVARSMSGKTSENDEGLRMFTANVLDVVVRPNGYACILVHHSGHAEKDRSRGWSGFPAALDGSVKVSMDKQPGGPAFVSVVTTESRSGSGDDSFQFRIDVQEILGADNFGNPIAEPVLHYVGEAPPTESRKRPRSADVKSLDILQRMYEEHRQTKIAGGMDPATALVNIADWRDAVYATMERSSSAAKQKAFVRAKGHLIDDGIIAVEGIYVRILDAS